MQLVSCFQSFRAVSLITQLTFPIRTSVNVYIKLHSLYIIMWTLFLYIFLATVCHGKDNFTKKPPTFSETYSAKGTLNIPYAEIQEPFYAWYNKPDGKSRIDYYGGVAKTFQLTNANIKIIPVTKDEDRNVETCFQIMMPASPQTVFPDISQYKYVGEDMIGGIPCSKWSYTYSFDDKINRYTMWTRTKNAYKNYGENAAVPVRFEMKGFNVVFGSHYDHYYLDYDWYSPEAPSDNVFDVSNYSCQSMPDNADRHLYTFNPMKEFVENYENHLHVAFEDFKNTHNKSYDSQKEHLHRLNIFRQNARFIHSHNRAGRSFQLGVNHLADKTDLEMKALRGYRQDLRKNSNPNPFPYSRERVKKILKNAPDSLDWRLNGAVTPVKDQSVCGSCWSFGTTGTLEGAYFLKTGKQVRLSQQALVDCSWGENNNGCDGGLDTNSYEWIKFMGGIPTEDDYGPYLGQDGYCHVNKSMNLITIKSYVCVNPNNKEALKAALAVHGPISVAIDASHKTFSFYSNGVYYDENCSSSSLDHAVLAVGYGKLNGEEYWLIKNSWSTYWGNDGYVLMSMKNNNCGVMTSPTYVEM